MPKDSRYNFLPEWVTTKNSPERQNLERDISLLNPHAVSIFNAMLEYAEKYHSSYIPADGLLKAIMEYGEKVNDVALKNQASITEFLKPIYSFLVKNKYSMPEIIDKKIVAIILKDPKSPTEEDIKNIKDILKKEYEKCKEEEKKPFPSIENFGNFHFYPTELYIISLKEYSEKLSSPEEINKPFTKILLPENIDIFLPTEIFKELYKIALAKMELYLSFSENSKLIFNKLRERFSSLQVIKDIKQIFPLESNPADLLASLATEILGYIQNFEKDLALWESCQIIQNIAYKRGIETQKRILSQEAFSMMLKITEKIPSFFNRSVILKFRENYTNFKLFSTEDFIKLTDEFLQKYSAKDGSQPLIVTDYHNEKIYIHRANFYKNLLNFLDKTFLELHKKMSNEYTHRAKFFLKEPFMKNESTFEEYVKNHFFSETSFLIPFFREPEYLYSIISYCESKNPEAKNATKRFFHNVNGKLTLRSFSEILDLNYEKILKEAKLYLPFFEQFNIFQFIISLFKNFGKKLDKAVDAQLKAKKEMPTLNELVKPVTKKQSSPLTKPKVETKEQKKNKIDTSQLEEIEKELIGNSSIEDMLNLYENRWNHVINPQTRKENLQYVKEKIASRLRLIKKPEYEIIKKETEDLITTDKNLKNISDQEALKKYIILVMIEYFLRKK
ncbi:MAG: hypothetical protein N2258_05480 [Brevinematales bacterium]|nr:hypothetical protein [Brevinematales bacterium]